MDKNKTQSSVSCCGASSSGTEAESCCQAGTVSGKKQPITWITGFTDTPAGGIPQVDTRLSFIDTLGSWKARWTLSGRMNYKVPPGLYSVGNPDGQSPVLVTANYKMSFDRLRRELGGLNLWIMVLDTKGINVWCAAGKGTFGTAELINRIIQVQLADIVAHRTLVLPQLGAPGVAAHEVSKQTGFNVVYGPVRARDIPEFLKAGMKATPAMREVRFGFVDRLILTPIELVGTIRAMLVGLAVLFVIQLISHGNATFYQLARETIGAFMPYFGAVVAGAVLVPVLLPYIPGRALAWKGWLLGLIWAGLYTVLLLPAAGWWHYALFLLLLPPIASFLGMNFTGATTYTSLSGVVKEMKIALPAQIISAGLGIIVWIGTLIGQR